MTVKVGSAYAEMALRYDQFMRGANEVEARLQKLRQATAQPIVAGVGGGGGAGGGTLALGGAQTQGLTQQSAAARRALADFERLDRQYNQVRDSEIRAAVASGGYARALQLIDAQLQAAGQGTVRYNNLLAQQAQVQRQAESATRFGAGASEAFRNQLIGVIGPAALLTAGIGAATKVVQSFADAFKFKAQLDATTLSINTQLTGVRVSSVLWADATAFAKRYALTQQETSEAIQASIPILRTSNASLTDVESTLLRLQAKKPEKSIADAARALDELRSGQVISLEHLFNVIPEDANRMKHEIAGGADAVKVLSDYLTKAGLGMDVLENRTKGAIGAVNRLTKAEEDLKIAEAKLAEGFGVKVIEARTRSTNALADLTGGHGREAINDFNAAMAESVGISHEQAVSLAQGQNAVERYNSATAAYFGTVERGTPSVLDLAQAEQIHTHLLDEHRTSLINTSRDTALLAGEQRHLADEHRNSGQIVQQTSAQIQEFNANLQQNATQSQISAAQSTILKQQQADIAETAALAAQGMLGEGNQAVILAKKLHIAQDEAQLLINANQALAAGKALADFRAEERGGKSEDQLKSEATQKAGFDRAHNEFLNRQKQIHDAQVQFDLANAKTAAQRVAIYQRELAQTTDVVARLQLQTQIQQERNSKQRVGTAQRTADQLATIEENSGLQQARIQRENLERLRDQQEDYEVGRSRKQEDFERERRKLLAEGRRYDAGRLTEDFQREQRRAQEDFDRQRSRTLRNNQEGLGDVDARTDLRQSQIQRRAGRTGAAVAGGGGVSGGPPGLPALPTSTAAALPPLVVRVQVAPVSVQIDSETIVNLTWPEIEQRVDADLAQELATIGIVLPPGGTQTAVAGARP